MRVSNFKYQTVNHVKYFISPLVGIEELCECYYYMIQNNLIMYLWGEDLNGPNYMYDVTCCWKLYSYDGKLLEEDMESRPSFMIAKKWK